MARLPLLVFCAALLGACASARGGGGVGPVATDGGIQDSKPWPKDDLSTWPKQDKGRKDGKVHDIKPWPKDLPPPPPDMGTPDLPPPKPCPDQYELNNNCSGNRNLGIVNEGGAWIKKTATLSPTGDVDWFAGEGHEASHTCIPFTSQTYYFRLRVDIPTGRNVKVCVVKGACSGADSCQTKTGPAQVNVNYKVSGTCTLNDDTKARMMVQALDSKHDCTQYTISYGYGK